MADAELRNMIMNFRVSDLQVLLGYNGLNKTGKKQELQSRALDLLKTKPIKAESKIRELDNRRYHNQLIARPANYELRERSMNDNQTSHFDHYLNNSYSSHGNSSIRSTPMSHTSSSNYTAPAKTYIPPAPPVNTNINSVAHYLQQADVKFKDLPFYDVLCVLVRPSSLFPEASERFQETSLCFTLSASQAHGLASSKGAHGNYESQILLRFCLLDNSCEQEDNFPPSISVKVNGKVVQLPNPIPTNRPGVEPKRPSKPVNITAFSKLSPYAQNVVTVSWASTYGRSYAAATYIVRQLSSDSLLQRLKNNGIRNPDLTTVMIKEKLQQGQDTDIATTNLRVSLVCPLGKVRMELPCRAITCSHIQCFDAFLYIQMNEKKSKWICPVCDKPALFRALAIDGLFVDIASKVPLDCSEVEFDESGTWTPVMVIKKPKEAKVAVENSLKKSTKAIEVVDLDSESDSEAVWQFNSLSSNTNSVNPPSESPVPSQMYIQSHTELCSSTPLDTYLSTSSQYSSLHSSINLPNQQTEPICILPDLSSTPLEDSLLSVPSSSGLGSSTFSHLPYNSESYVSHPYSDQMPVTSLVSNPYNNVDFSSFINISDIEASKIKDYEKRSSTEDVPDVISLE